MSTSHKNQFFFQNERIQHRQISLTSTLLKQETKIFPR
jgi:hypothetical protein